MTSAERREGRYRRRKEKRERQKLKNCGQNLNFDDVFSYRNLYKSYRNCRKGVCWKNSVQKYVTQAPLNVAKTYNLLQAGKYHTPGFFEFDVYERGKHRHIRSTVIGERVVQRCLCDNSLVPVLGRTFIYDNGAALQHKGYHFSQRRLKAHLHKHYRKHGTEGYVLLFDFTKFFDNVSHELLKEQLHSQYDDERILKLTEHFIDAFGDKGMGLGSQISQVLSLASANRLDHFIKEKLGIKYYGRYMDDGYLIHESKEYLQYCLEEIKKVCAELGIILSLHKTQIVKLSHGFTYLKARTYLTETGRVVQKIYKRSVTRMRIKFKKLKKKLDNGLIPFDYIYSTWQSWKSYADTFNAYHTTQTMADLYNRLYMNWEDFYALS